MSDMSKFKYIKDQRPPDINLCRIHEISCRVGRPQDLDDDNIIDVCPCCGSPFDNAKIPLCTKHNKLDFLGPGFPLFYEFLIFCIVCIFLLFCIQGIYGLSTNNDGEACHLSNIIPDSDGKIRKCTENGINTYSWFNKVYRDDVQSGLNLCGAFVLLIVLNVFKHRHKNVEIRLDSKNISPSDYTIQVSEIPTTENEEDIKNFFENCMPNRAVKISKVCLAYHVENYVRLKNKKEALIAEQSSLLSKLTFFQRKNKPGLEKIQQKKQQVEEILAKTQEKIEEFERECEQDAGKKFCGVAFISLQNEEDHKALMEYWEMSFFQIVLTVVMAKVFKRNAKTYKGKLVSVVRAPEPTDVIWENLGFSPIYRFKALIMTNLATFCLLCLCGAAIFGINYAQAYLAEEAKTDSSLNSTVQGIGILSAALVLVVNVILELVVNKLVNLEKPDNFTQFNISLTEKLAMAQFLNTAIVTFIVNYVVSADYIYGDGGMLYNVFIILISNALVPLFVSFFDVAVLVKFLKRVQIIEEGENCNYTQFEANQAFEGPPVVPSLRYVVIIKSMLLTTFYSSVLPIGLLFCLFNLFAFYWLDKYLLLRRYGRPQTLGANLSEEMVDVFIEFTIAVFSIGCAAFEKIIYKALSWYVIVQLVVTLVVFVFPVHLINELLCPIPKKVFCGKKYEEVKLDFLNDYDRCNPVTMNKALKDWVGLLAEKEAEGRKEAILNDKNKAIKRKVEALKKTQAKNQVLPISSHETDFENGKKEQEALLKDVENQEKQLENFENEENAKENAQNKELLKEIIENVSLEKAEPNLQII